MLPVPAISNRPPFSPSPRTLTSPTMTCSWKWDYSWISLWRHDSRNSIQTSRIEHRPCWTPSRPSRRSLMIHLSGRSGWPFRWRRWFLTTKARRRSKVTGTRRHTWWIFAGAFRICLRQRRSRRVGMLRWRWRDWTFTECWRISIRIRFMRVCIWGVLAFTALRDVGEDALFDRINSCLFDWSIDRLIDWSSILRHVFFCIFSVIHWRSLQVPSKLWSRGVR